MTIGERIRMTRETAGLTQRELGERCKIAEPTIRRYELGKLNPKYTTLQTIASALGVPVSYLTQVEINYISLDLQQMIIEKIRSRIDEQLVGVDSEDFYAVFGTYDFTTPFEDVYSGRKPVTKSRLAEIADSLGVSMDYLLGFTDEDGKEEGNGPHTED